MLCLRKPIGGWGYKLIELIDNKMNELLRIRKPRRYSSQSRSNAKAMHPSRSQSLLSGHFIEKKKAIVTSLLKRNYYSPQRTVKQSNEFLLSSEQLNAMLYSMKKSYNHLLAENNEVLIQIQEEKATKERLLRKESELRESRDFSLSPYEKISVLNSDETVADVRNRIEKLESELNEVEAKSTFVEEYTYTINQMIEKEKEHLKSFNEQIIQQESRSKQLVSAQLVLDANLSQKRRMQLGSQKYLMTIDDELEKVNALMNKQDLRREKLLHITQRKDNRLIQLKNSYYKTTLDRNEQLSLIKRTKQEELSDLSDFQCQKGKKETKSISIVLGMLLLQKHLLDNPNGYSIDVKALKASTEYTLLFSEPYISRKQPFDTKQSHQSAHSSSSHKATKPKANVEEMIEEFNAIDLKRNQMRRYYRQLVTNEQFTREKMMELNEKVLRLSCLKDSHTAKVNEIIVRDYKNLKDLLMSNSRFAPFIQSNQNRCQTANVAEKKHIGQTYQLISSLLEDESNNHPDQKEMKQNERKFIVESHHCLSLVKEAIDSLLSSFKQCGFFSGIDASSFSDAINKEILPIKQSFLSSIEAIANKQKALSKREYIKKLLAYSIEKLKDEDAKFISSVISASSDSFNQFLNSNLILEAKIFCFFADLKEMKSLITLLENILLLHASTLHPSDRTNLPRQSFVSKKGHSYDDDDDDSPLSSMKKKAKDTQNTNISSSGLPLNNSIDNYNDSFNEIEAKNSTRPVTSKMTLSNSISMKLYEPALRKAKYLRWLNEGLDHIKEDTTVQRRYEFKVNKSRKSFNKLKKEFYPYNNPNININLLSSETYKLITSQIQDISKKRNIISGKK